MAVYWIRFSIAFFYVSFDNLYIFIQFPFSSNGVKRIEAKFHDFSLLNLLSSHWKCPPVYSFRDASICLSIHPHLLLKTSSQILLTVRYCNKYWYTIKDNLQNGPPPQDPYLLVITPLCSLLLLGSSHHDIWGGIEAFYPWICHVGNRSRTQSMLQSPAYCSYLEFNFRKFLGPEFTQPSHSGVSDPQNLR